MHNSNNLKNALIIIIFFLFVAGSLAVAFYFYSRYQKTNQMLQAIQTTPTNPPLTDNTQIISAVSKIFELPSTSPDTIYTIKDTAQLKDQPFFAQAINGDILIVYVQAKKAILYRPSSDKIVDVAPVSLNTNPVSGATSGTNIGIVTPVTPTLIPSQIPNNP